MLQFLGLQRVGHDLANEQQNINVVPRWRSPSPYLSTPSSGVEILAFLGVTQVSERTDGAVCVWGGQNVWFLNLCLFHCLPIPILVYLHTLPNSSCLRTASDHPSLGKRNPKMQMTCSLLSTQLCKEPFKTGLIILFFFPKKTSILKFPQPLKESLKQSLVERLSCPFQMNLLPALLRI